MMPVNSLGIATGRDHFTVAFTRRDLQERFERFLELDGEEARAWFQLGPDSRDWRVKLAQDDLARRDWKSHIRPLLYRPFDRRQTCYTGASRGFHCMARQKVVRHFLEGEPNLGLSTTRSVEIREGWRHIFATAEMTQLHSVSIKEVNYLFPLYLCPKGGLPEEDLFAHQNGRRPNLSAEFVRALCGKLQAKFVPEGLGRPGKQEVGPERIFNYAYAVFHSPAYRKRYSEFLRGDFPRLPLTSNLELFGALAVIGGELVDLHAKGKGGLHGLSYPVKGYNVVEAVRYQPPQGKEPGRVWINDRQYFEGVPESAWTFPIGGYQPAQRWLKDRIGRTLGFDDQVEYQRIVGALIQTRHLMGEIDACIEQHGGWPLE
ncbi:MAG: type ISP restriction/modification enzyme [Limisphaerales bacterium]